MGGDGSCNTLTDMISLGYLFGGILRWGRRPSIRCLQIAWVDTRQLTSTSAVKNDTRAMIACPARRGRARSTIKMDHSWGEDGRCHTLTDVISLGYIFAGILRAGQMARHPLATDCIQTVYRLYTGLTCIHSLARVNRLKKGRFLDCIQVFGQRVFLLRFLGQVRWSGIHWLQTVYRLYTGCIQV